jgi:hypothetical protein
VTDDETYLQALRKEIREETLTEDLHTGALQAALAHYQCMWSDPDLTVEQCLSDLDGLSEVTRAVRRRILARATFAYPLTFKP